MSTTATPQFTPLNEPQSAVVSGLPAGFDPTIALLMAQCCQGTYAQLANWSYGQNGTTYDVTQLLTAVTITKSTVTPITSYEPLDFGTSSTAQTPNTGDFVPLPYGFALQVTESSIGAFNVIALRGTQSYAEWIEDADAVPATFALGNASPGFVHGGFYDAYTRGTPGQSPSTASGTGLNRIPGSIAAQVAEIIGQIGASGTPLYVTGHSLGAALATLCAADLVMNWGNGTDNGASSSWSALNVYVLASPRVAAGFQLPDTFLNYFISAKTIDNALASVLSPGIVLDAVELVANGLASALSTAIATEVDNAGGLFQAAWAKYFATGGYAVVHAADIVPILPPTSVGASDGLGVTFAQAIPAAQSVTFCAQTGGIEGNHAIATYAWFLGQLQQQGGSQSAVKVFALAPEEPAAVGS